LFSLINNLSKFFFFEKLKNDFSESDILNSGLFYFDEKNKKYIERFRDRLIFPINGLTGSTIAFGGRIISNQKSAKYINSPETLFLKKVIYYLILYISTKKIF